MKEDGDKFWDTVTELPFLAQEGKTGECIEIVNEHFVPHTNTPGFSKIRKLAEDAIEMANAKGHPETAQAISEILGEALEQPSPAWQAPEM